MPPIDVLILTQDYCGFCEEARAVFQRLTREFPLSIAILDINSPEGQELAARGGVLFPPGVFIGGEPFCYGRPSEQKIRREMERRLSRSP
ncbi:glutaredoxin domain-containing protein [Microvirga sp. VF16]|uniref:glutaredoxin family protein n=1 Tax=Microvirga sp. VF16 TaxID=2807101 RepID=UPI00193EA5BD|nr:glutaredoxin domain-containing protein [Microvirga sp. VF16]QRM35297.1 hypothetical protein JO965_40780 [Microvirga sp. VF16]